MSESLERSVERLLDHQTGLISALHRLVEHQGRLVDSIEHLAEAVSGRILASATVLPSGLQPTASSPSIGDRTRDDEMNEAVARSFTTQVQLDTYEAYKQVRRRFEDDPELGGEPVTSTRICSVAIEDLLAQLTKGTPNSHLITRLRNRRGQGEATKRIPFNLSEVRANYLSDLLTNLNWKRGRTPKITLARFVEVALEDLLPKLCVLEVDPSLIERIRSRQSSQ